MAAWHIQNPPDVSEMGTMNANVDGAQRAAANGEIVARVVPFKHLIALGVDRGYRDRPFVSANLINTVALGLKGTCVSLNTVGRGY